MTVRSNPVTGGTGYLGIVRPRPHLPSGRGVAQENVTTAASQFPAPEPLALNVP